MEFGWIGVIVAIIAAVYCLTNHFNEEKLREKDEEKRRTEEDLLSQLHAEQEKSEVALQAALRLAILTKIERYASDPKSLKDWTTDELADLVSKHTTKAGLTSLQDVDACDIARVIKIAIFAEGGLLDHYSDFSGQSFRLIRDGSFVPLTEEELEKIIAHDYDFILNDPRNN